MTIMAVLHLIVKILSYSVQIYSYIAYFLQTLTPVQNIIEREFQKLFLLYFSQ